MLKVELIYDKDCPNVQEAQEQLSRAFHETGIPSKWQEWNRGAIETPAYVRSYGSPTILVNGQDVAGLLPSDEGNCCRLYTGEDGDLQGVSPVEVICTALLKSNEIPRTNSEVKDQRRSWQTAFTALPTFGAVMLPNLTCPSCEVSVLDMGDPSVARRAKELGIRSVPSIVIDGKLADCCANSGPVEDTLRAAGLGQPILN